MNYGVPGMYVHELLRIEFVGENTEKYQVWVTSK